MRTIRFIALSTVLALAFGIALAAYGGIRGPGTYCGVVVFDRWDTCFLLTGHFITYVSENVKNVLRSFKGQAVQVDPFEVIRSETGPTLLAREPACEFGPFGPSDGDSVDVDNSGVATLVQ